MAEVAPLQYGSISIGSRHGIVSFALLFMMRIMAINLSLLMCLAERRASESEYQFHLLEDAGRGEGSRDQARW